MTTAALRPGLPAPTSARWQPLRLGLVDLFYYDVEEFWFRDGHLLLRGNNGTGKSKVLALALPFLLDGDHRPQRVEPDGDPAKRMEWNLLLGGRYHDRLGYTWLELGRVDPIEGPETLTIGCGLKAVAGRGIAQKWFFLTSQRVGADLHLVDANGLALSRERLRDALGDRGQLLDGVEAYRRAVDERLFGLGPDRYAALVTLLIQLRQPQLSKRPNEEALSRALTEALPPLEQDVIADVAAAMRRLDDDRAQLADVVEARAAVAAFAQRYRRYAAVATRRRAGVLRHANSRYEDTGRQLREAAAARDAASAEEEARRDEDARLRVRLDELRAAERTLRESPELRDAARLRQAADAAARAAGEARRADGDLVEAESALRDRRRELAEANAALEAAREDVDRRAATAADAARSAGVGADHERLAGPVLDASVADLPEHDAEALAARRAAAVHHVRRLLRGVDDATRERNRARADADEADREHDAAAEARAGADAARVAAADAYGTAAESWLASTVELRVPDAAAVVAAVCAWAADPDGASPLATAAEQAGRVAAGALGAEDSRLADRSTVLHAERELVEGERARLEAGDQPLPPPSPTRDAAARADRPGAPLWQLIDFADHLDAGERAGLEAALEGAGLLDAWVTPDGGLLAGGTLDTAVTSGPAAARSLAEVLRPAAQDRVAADVVERLLHGIGLGPASADTWVDVDGRFRLGVAEGAWRKPDPAYVGFASREAARQRRLAELSAALVDLDAQLADVHAARQRLAVRRDGLEAELANLPSAAPLHTAVAAAAAARDALDAAERRAAARRERLAAAERALEKALATRDTEAAELGLPTDADALDGVSQAVDVYRLAQARLWPAVTALRAAAERRDRAGEHLAVAEDVVSRRRGVAEEAARHARELAVEHDTLRSLVGTAVAEAEARLAAVIGEREAAETAREELRDRLAEARGAVTAAVERLRLLDERHRLQREERAAAVDAFRRFTATGIVAASGCDVALPDPGEAWAPDPAVRLVRRIDQALADVDDSPAAEERVSAAITGAPLVELQAVLAAQGASAEGELHEDAFVVVVRYRSLTEPPHRLVTVLDDEVAHREQLLDAREREILENHLVSEVASHLSALIADADARVAAMNAELAQRPTSTGMVLRLRWDPDEAEGPTGIAEARRRLLRQREEMWSGDDRAALGGFLKAEIDRVRAADEAGTWAEQLTRAFDYRRWHRFAIQRKQADGSWRKATGPASGGERVLAVTLPLFAAASSHYSTAAATAPRLVLLDEAFAGVDDDARRQCMGLLSTFDLDYVMTSEREWGCYPEVPGLSICHLVRREGVEAVHVSRWEWDGRVRQQIAHAGDSARQPRPTPADGPLQADLDLS